MAATLDRISGGRIDINVVPGGIQGDFERLGEASDHAHRYARAEEFIAACRTLWESPEPKTFEGEHVRLNGALCSPGPVGSGPKFYLGGASDAALKLAGRQSDVYLAWILPREVLGPFFDRARDQFSEAGRTPSFGLRTHLVVRDTEAAAWQAAEELLSQAADAVKLQRQAVFAGSAMVGQRAQSRAVTSTTEWASASGTASRRCASTAAPPSWATPNRSPRRSWATGGSASTSSYCPASRTWRSAVASRRKWSPR